MAEAQMFEPYQLADISSGDPLGGLTLVDPLLEPSQTSNLFVGSLLAFLGLGVSAGSGIGGGCILLPIYRIFFELDFKSAIPLANITVFGGAAANLVLNIRDGYSTGRPLINWEVVQLFEPLTFIGALVGTYLETKLTGFTLLLAFQVFLWITIFRTLRKGQQLWKSEGLSGENPSGFVEESANPDFWDDLRKIRAVCVIFSGALIFKVLQTQLSRRYDSKLLLVFLNFLLLSWSLGWFCWFRSQVLRSNPPPLDGSPAACLWNRQNTIKFPMICALAGVVAGSLGLGGGIIKAPLMLELGMHPQVVSATSSAMIFFTCGLTSFSFLVMGSIHLVPGLLALLGGAFSVFCGQHTFNLLIKLTKKPSIIVFSLVVMLTASSIALFMPVNEIPH